MSDQAKELRALANEPEAFTVSGTHENGAPATFDLQLRPMRLVPYGLRAQEIVEPMVTELGTIAGDGTITINRTRLMMRHATRFAELAIVMLAGAFPGDEKEKAAAAKSMLATLDEPQFDRLLDKLIEVNSSFFVRRLLAVHRSSLESGSSTFLDPTPSPIPTESPAPGPTSSPH
jgi:hypothetical protein